MLIEAISSWKPLSRRRVGFVASDKVQLAPSSWIAIVGLLLVAIGSGFSGVWLVVAAATANTERLVKLEMSIIQLNFAVSEMSQHNQMLALHAEKLEELQKFKDRIEKSPSK